MEQILLQVGGLTKRYPGFALDGVSFSVPGGSIMGFVGENGAGKTTTLKLILDELPRDGGTVKIFGLDNRERGSELRAQIPLHLGNSAREAEKIFRAQEKPVPGFAGKCKL